MNEIVEPQPVRFAGELLNKMFNSMHIHIAYLDSRFNFIRVNRKYAAADGHEPDFFVGKNHFALYPNAENEAIFRHVVETGEPHFVYERPFSYPENPERGVSYWDWSLEPVVGDGGKVEALVLSLIDVTERVKTRTRVRESSENLRHTQELLSEAQRIALIGNWDFDLQRKSFWLSEESYRILGLTPNEPIGTYDTFRNAIHPEDRETVIEAVNAALRGEKPFNIDHRIVLPDGAIRFVHGRGEVIFDEEHNPARLIGTVQDITDRKKSEIELHKVNRALRTLSRCNQVLIHARDERALLRDTCRMIVDAGGYRAAWFAYVERGEGEALRFGAQARFGEPADFTRSIKPPHPAFAVAHDGNTRVVREVPANPDLANWHEEANKLGYRSLISLPLKWNLVLPLGVLTIYDADRNAFGADEIALLEELAEDLCYAITALRTRRSHEETAKRLQKALEGTVLAVASTVEMRDPYTAGHQRRVSQLAAAIAREIGMPEDEITALRMAATVHDIGKVYVPAEILNRPGPLNDVEMTLVKTHAQVGYNILSGVEFPWPVADAVRQHHERLDGSGYPQGLKGDQILLGARILAIADVVEAMYSHRPYRPGIGMQEALQEITTHRGTKYDPAAVDACVVLLRDKGFKFQPTEPTIGGRRQPNWHPVTSEQASERG